MNQHLITQLPSASRALGDNALSDLYAVMRGIRRAEETTRELRLANEVQGSVHLEIGQEAVSTGVLAALNHDDPVYATYRGHGWALASGLSYEKYFAELLGRVGGTNAGRGGSAYLSAPDVWFMGENSIVGAGAPIAVGAALAASFQRSGKVVVTVFGDGATNQGSVHEAMNMASAMRLPVIFVCENNVYSELTPIAQVVGNPRLHERAAAYGMFATEVDGNDVEAVRGLASEVVGRARAGEGPAFIEAHTYRLCGHYIGDPESYRTQDEIAERAHTEPLVIARQRLLEGGMSTGDVDAIDAAVEDAIQSAVRDALAQPLTPTETVKEGLYE